MIICNQIPDDRRRWRMTKLSFLVEDKKKEQLDLIAAMYDRDRSYILNEAVDSYLALQKWQLEQIDEGIQQDEAGEYATDEEVAAAFALWKRK